MRSIFVVAALTIAVVGAAATAGETPSAWLRNGSGQSLHSWSKVDW